MKARLPETLQHAKISSLARTVEAELHRGRVLADGPMCTKVFITDTIIRSSGSAEGGRGFAGASWKVKNRGATSTAISGARAPPKIRRYAAFCARIGSFNKGKTRSQSARLSTA